MKLKVPLFQRHDLNLSIHNGRVGDEYEIKKKECGLVVKLQYIYMLRIIIAYYGNGQGLCCPFWLYRTGIEVLVEGIVGCKAKFLLYAIA